MVTVTTTAITQTFLEGYALGTTYNTTATHTTYQDTGITIANVPQGSKIYYNISYSDGASASMDIRITDGTNTWAEHLGLTGSGSVSSLDGSVTKSSGGTGTVKVQIRAADANAVSLITDGSGISWVCCTDASKPIVYSGGVQNMVLSGKRSIGTLKCYYAPIDNTSSNTVAISGVIGDQSITDQEESGSLDIDTLTTQLDINFSSAPTWTDTRGIGALIIGYDGVHIEAS